MVKGREQSDRCGVPEKGGNAPGGIAATASEEVEQLDLFRETADSPKGDVAGADLGQPRPATSAVPKSRTTERRYPPALTMEEVADEENLRSAFGRVASNKGAPGPDRQSIDEVREHLEELLPELRSDLLSGRYRPGMIRRVWIPKPGRGQRGLGIPNVIDRIVAQAVLQVLSPHYEPTFHSSSHGFRPGRSCHTAIAEAVGYLEDGAEWLVDIDLEEFFDRVHHQRLIAKLEQKVKDRQLIQLIHRMLKAKVVMPDGVVVSNDEGVPQGGPLSPLLSNIVLDELDRELERRGHRFVRYADDCNIYVRSERAGKRVMASITRFIEGRMRLKVNQEKSAVIRPEEGHFLGFCLKNKPMVGGVEVTLSKRTKERLATRVRELTPRNWGRSFVDCISQVNRYLLGWIDFFSICGRAEVGLTLRKTDAHIRRRLRAIRLKQRGRKRHIARWLIKLGVKPARAWGGVYGGRKSLWVLSHIHPVEMGTPKAYFAAKGLVSLEKRWKELQPEVNAPGQLMLALG